MRRAARSGLTLVELSIGLLIAAILGVALWAGFFADLRRFTIDQARIDGLQGALLLDEMLSRDLARLALPATADSAGPVQVGDSGRSLAFPIAGDGPAIETVRYALDAARVVSRTRAGRTERVSSLRGAELEFSLVDIRTRAPAAGPHYGAAPLLVLKYRVTCAPAGCDALANRDAARITVVGAIPVPNLSLRDQHPYWNPLPAADRRSR